MRGGTARTRRRFVRFQAGNPGRVDARVLAQRIYDLIQRQRRGGQDTDADLSEAERSTVKRAWDESKVKRHPKGTPVDESGAGGGRFAPKDESERVSSADKPTEGDGKGKGADSDRERAGQLADALMKEAAAAEPRVTKLLQSVAKANGGEMWGLEYRLKQKDSLVRKILNDAVEKRVDLETAAEMINDSLRYTTIFPQDSFVDSAAETINRLAELGFKQYDHKFKNYWKPGNSYRGYNCVFVNEDTGLTFELQFHTPQSISVKEESHKIYERARTIADGPEKQSLVARMRNLWDSISAPPRWEALPGMMISR